MEVDRNKPSKTLRVMGAFFFYLLLLSSFAMVVSSLLIEKSTLTNAGRNPYFCSGKESAIAGFVMTAATLSAVAASVVSIVLRRFAVRRAAMTRLAAGAIFVVLLVGWVCWVYGILRLSDPIICPEDVVYG
jgi:hypothetical protein